MPRNIVAEFVVSTADAHGARVHTTNHHMNVHGFHENIAAYIEQTKDDLSNHVVQAVRDGLFNELFEAAYTQYAQAHVIRLSLAQLGVDSDKRHRTNSRLLIPSDADDYEEFSVASGMGSSITDHLTGRVTLNLIRSLASAGLDEGEQLYLLKAVVCSAIGRAGPVLLPNHATGVEAIAPQFVYMEKGARNIKGCLQLIQDQFDRMPDVEALLDQGRSGGRRP